MENSNVVKIVLIISGIIGISVGGALLFAPVAFEASANIVIEENSNLLSELRASGGALLVAGIVMLLGVFVSKITYTAVVLSVLFYLSYGLSRVFSSIIDGVLETPLIIATVTELIIGCMSLLVLIKWVKKEQRICH